ncbi:hypothetical protein CVT26_008933 [Gymnopilus dilepis]|uniref:dihydrofolate reductase n=1 Tax=Gymnopilus dilepis TaxID=231916 RepID=A0A409YRR5_9AGAR|nr:hypothetical protein CVT26_008933 [Gymnopilus dilepis]
MATLRHEFYETEEKLTLSIFDKGADPAQVSVKFEPRKLTYTNGEKSLVLEPLKGQIDPEKSEYTVGKVKVEVRLVKVAQGRWTELVGDSPDPLAAAPVSSPSPPAAEGVRRPKKNWDALTTTILSSEKEKTSDEDPNVGGDAALNSFFQKIFADADEDTKRAMMKSYSESGGTTLSTNWDEVRKGKVEVKPPQGAEWKNRVSRLGKTPSKFLMSRYTIIVAATKANGIGAKGRLPWRLSKEMKYFAQVTSAAPEGKQNVVVMGRTTWESIPKKFRPLPKRSNVVISRNREYDLAGKRRGTTDGSTVLKDNLKTGLSVLDANPTTLHRGFIIGGATLYSESLAFPLSPTDPCVDRVLLTRILSPDFHECDVFMPDFLKEGTTGPTEWKRSSHAALQEWVGFEVPEGEQEENGVKYEFQMWVRSV